MGGTNNPDPNAAYIADVTQRYVDPLADLPYDPPPVGVHTPEQFFPVFGSQTFDDSVAEGVPDLQESVSRAAWILVAIHGELYAAAPTDSVSGLACRRRASTSWGICLWVCPERGKEFDVGRAS
jgi:PE-PPE domain